MNKNYKNALVLLNMGGARNKNELEMFLRNMFNDKNILTFKSDLFRSMIASLIVLSRKNSAWENYEQIGGSSPINPLTEKLIDKLQNEFKDTYVTQAMRYTPPLAPKCVELIKQQGIEEVILLPLYPQYSTTTTKSSLEDFIEVAHNQFNLKVIDPFYEDAMFNACIADDILKTIENPSEYNLIFSAHGLPQKIVDNGDPYEKHVNGQVEILKALFDVREVKFESINVAYQSKVGPMKWLEPSLETMLENFNDKKVLIYPISFIIDNSETVFELDIEYKEVAEELGVKEYKVVKCMNDSDAFVKVIKNLIE
jgi:ferrochelatase